MRLNVNRKVISSISVTMKYEAIIIDVMDASGNVISTNKFRPQGGGAILSYAATIHDALYIACTTETSECEGGLNLTKHMVERCCINLFNIRDFDVKFSGKVNLSTACLDDYRVTGFYIDGGYIPGHEDNGTLQAICINSDSDFVDVDVEELFESVYKEKTNESR